MNAQVLVNCWGLLLCSCAFVVPTFSQLNGQPLPTRLKEISGLASANNDSLWAINDGGNSATLFKINPSNGAIMQEIPINTQNIDWEELCTDPDGRFWIADFGNNRNDRKNLCIYCFDPHNNYLDSINFSFPDQFEFPPKSEAERNFDTEAMVWKEDTLHLFTKSRFKGHHFTKHYVLLAQPGKQVAVLQDSLLLPKSAVTGAAISNDGTELVLIAYFFRLKPWPFTRATLYHFSGYAGSSFFTGKMRKKRLPKLLFARQFESVTHFRGNWWVANEQLKWQKPQLWKLRFQ